MKGIKRMKVKKFQNELNVDIRHDVKLFELNTLSAIMSKARLLEKNKNDCKKQQPQRSQFLGKRPAYITPSTRAYGKNSGSKNKRPMYVMKSLPSSVEKEASKDGNKETKVECQTCFGLHETSTCKSTLSACSSCRKFRHRSTNYKNPILKPVFCFICKQRGHTTP